MWKAILAGRNHLDDLSMSGIGNGEKGMIRVHINMIHIRRIYIYMYIYTHVYMFICTVICV